MSAMAPPAWRPGPSAAFGWPSAAIAQASGCSEPSQRSRSPVGTRPPRRCQSGVAMGHGNRWFSQLQNCDLTQSFLYVYHRVAQAHWISIFSMVFKTKIWIENGRSDVQSLTYRARSVVSVGSYSQPERCTLILSSRLHIKRSAHQR